MNTKVKIAIAGLGTVGVATVKLLQQKVALLSARAGRTLELVAVSARDKRRDRGIELKNVAWYDDPVQMARDCDAEIIVELIGGAEGPARATVEAAIAAGKSVVTANKALIASYGLSLATAAEAKGVALNFEAAVAGGIPIIKALREGLAGNRIVALHGILNGTCNYILSAMRDAVINPIGHNSAGREFAEVLAEAQELGYAEADPSFDVDGIDTAHKLAILTSLAFGTEVNLEQMYIQGIRHVSPLDILYAEELGFRIKLLGIARLTEHGIEQRVHPCMIPKESAVASVEGVFNAVVVEGDVVGRSVYEGRGAGGGPTASAVVADIVDIAAGRRCLPFGVARRYLTPLPAWSMGQHTGAYYIRLMVKDVPGVLADITSALRDSDVSVESLLQRGHNPGESVPVVMTLHVTVEKALRKALERIALLDTVVELPRAIRIETL